MPLVTLEEAHCTNLLIFFPDIKTKNFILRNIIPRILKVGLTVDLSAAIYAIHNGKKLRTNKPLYYVLKSNFFVSDQPDRFWTNLKPWFSLFKKLFHLPLFSYIPFLSWKQFYRGVKNSILSDRLRSWKSNFVLVGDFSSCTKITRCASIRIYFLGQQGMGNFILFIDCFFQAKKFCPLLAV